MRFGEYDELNVTRALYDFFYLDGVKDAEVTHWTWFRNRKVSKNMNFPRENHITSPHQTPRIRNTQTIHFILRCHLIISSWWQQSNGHNFIYIVSVIIRMKIIVLCLICWKIMHFHCVHLLLISISCDCVIKCSCLEWISVITKHSSDWKILKTFTEGIKSSEKIETNSHQSGWYRQHIHESSWWFENVDNTYSVTDVIAAREREKKRQHYTSVAFPIQKTKHSITHDWILSLLDTTRDNLLRQLGQMYFLFKSKYSARPTIAHTHTQIHITDTQNILDSFSIVSKRRRVLFIVSTHNVFFLGIWHWIGAPV